MRSTFIILGDAGKDFTGRKATELIDTYVEVRVILLKIDNHDKTWHVFYWIFKATNLINDSVIIGKWWRWGWAWDSTATMFYRRNKTDKKIQDQGGSLQLHIYPPILDRYQNCLISSFATKESSTQDATRKWSGNVRVSWEQWWWYFSQWRQ